MTSKLRVLHLTTDAGGISGAERILIGLGTFADRGAFDVSFASVRAEGPLTPVLAATNWPVHSLGVEKLQDIPRGVARLRRLLRRERPHLLHTHLSHAAIFGAVATRLSNQTLVQTRHYTDAVIRYGSKTHARLDRWAATRCAAIAAVSDAAAHHLVTVEGIPASRVTVIKNGVDWDDLARRGPERGRALLDEVHVGRGPLVACAATFHPRKGHTVLIDAFARVVAAVPQAELVLLGRGPDQPDIERRVREAGIANHVHFLGHREDAFDLIAAADVYVQPSIEEGFGLAVLEAMAMSRPVVVSNVGGMSETVTSDVGVRVLPGDAPALADALVRVLGDAQLRQTLGQHGRERVRTVYSMRRMVAQYEDWYRALEPK